MLASSCGTVRILSSSGSSTAQPARRSRYLIIAQVYLGMRVYHVSINMWNGEITLPNHRTSIFRNTSIPCEYKYVEWGDHVT